MPIIDHLLASPRVRRSLWRLWYPFLTRRLRGEDVVFLNYAFEEDPPAPLLLDAADEPNRACIQLYRHVADPETLQDRDVLEVSCGHGGGASWLTRTGSPRHYTGLDLNPAGIAFCRARHRHRNLTFVRGDAERLPFPAASFDVVINVEASHCYRSLARFLAEVARVLRPGGRLLHADFRFRESIVAWENALAAAPLDLVRMRVINPEVVRGMNRNSARSLELLGRHLPSWLHDLGRDFAGTAGSRIHTALRTGEVSYRSYEFEKPRGGSLS